MDEIIDRSMKMCFSNEIMHQIGTRILENAENNGRVKSLELLSLKVIMKQRMIRDDNDKGEVMLKLLFREPLNLLDFMKPEVCELKYPTVRTDPLIMLTVLEQNLTTGSWLEVTMTRSSLELSFAGCIIGQIYNRENEQHDAHWVQKFVQVALRRRIRRIAVQFKGEHNYDHDFMTDYIRQVVDNIPRTTPPNGWESAINGSSRSIYFQEGYVLRPISGTSSTAFGLIDRFNPVAQSFYIDFTV